jgi:hypothetical protein
MAAKSKTIDNTTVAQAVATEAMTLASLIKQQNIQLAELLSGFEANKKRLSEISMGIFLADLHKEIPEIIGNHDYLTTSGKVSVNFKITGSAPKLISGKPAAEVLRNKFRETTDDLFDIKEEIEICESYDTLREQVKEHPEMFSIALRPLSAAQMMHMIEQHPDYLTVAVKLTQDNLKQYAEAYPDSVIKTPEVSFKKGFIEALEKIPDVAKKSVQKLICALLPEVTKSAVQPGK